MAKKSLSLWARERLSKTLWSSPWKEKTRWFEEFHFHRKYPLNAVLHISKKCCNFARRHHFSNFETRIRSLALHQHKQMEAIP